MLVLVTIARLKQYVTFGEFSLWIMLYLIYSQINRIYVKITS
jgi:hypothetical protein